MCKTAPVDTLAQPTRARLFALLGELERPATTAELADALGLHVNGVRAHLERLAAAGLVARERQRMPRGRPRDTWAAAPGAGAAPGQALGRWLARTMGRGRAAAGAAERTGREIGGELAGAQAAGDATTVVATTFTRLGFEPQVTSAAGGLATVTLRNCPYRDAAQENPDVVCALHRGMTLGLLDAAAPDAELRSFVPRDPATANCTLQIASGGR